MRWLTLLVLLASVLGGCVPAEPELVEPLAPEPAPRPDALRFGPPFEELVAHWMSWDERCFPQFYAFQLELTPSFEVAVQHAIEDRRDSMRHLIEWVQTYEPLEYDPVAAERCLAMLDADEGCDLDHQDPCPFLRGDSPAGEACWLRYECPSRSCAFSDPRATCGVCEAPELMPTPDKWLGEACGPGAIGPDVDDCGQGLVCQEGACVIRPRDRHVLGGPCDGQPTPTCGRWWEHGLSCVYDPLADANSCQPIEIVEVGGACSATYGRCPNRCACARAAASMRCARSTPTR